MTTAVHRLAIAAAAFFLTAACALAQAKHPFAIGATESGAPGTAFAAWLMAEQGRFTRLMTEALRGTRDTPAAFWTLAAVSFAYGVFHAAGPGHGKAVMASYMVANERALRRGLLLTFAAALLQALVAIVLVVVLRLLLGATAARMTNSALAIETASYAIVAALGAWLVWRKGHAFARAVGTFARPRPAFALAGGQPSVRFVCEEVDASDVSHANCGHLHAPDPTTLGGDLSAGTALGAVVAAGARPCSGAVVVLVFALAQDLFFVGIAAALCMALGTALTTGALATAAVYAKRMTVRLLGAETRRGLLVARGAELGAALLLLAFGVLLFLGNAVARSLA